MGLKVLKANDGTGELKHNRRKRKALLEELYTKATAQQRKMIDDLQLSYINKLQSMSTSMNRQSATWLWDDFSNRVWDILNSKPESLLYSTINTSVVDEDPYGHYNKDEIAAIGNAIAQGYFRQTPTKTQEPATEQTPATAPVTEYYNYMWNKGFHPNSDVSGSRNMLLTSLIDNLNTAINEVKLGKTFHNYYGGTAYSLADLEAKKAALEKYLNKTWGNNLESVSAGNDILSIMKSLSNDSSIADDYYNTYFKFDPSEAEQFLIRMREAGYTPSSKSMEAWAQKYLTDNGYNLWVRDGKTYVLDADGQPVLASTKIWYDPNDKDTYKKTFAIGPDGTFYYGGIDTSSLQTDSPFRGLVDEALRQIQDSYDTFTGNTTLTYSPYIYSGELVEKVAEALRNDSINPTNEFEFLDMGSFIYGALPYIAILQNHSNTLFDKDTHAPNFAQFDTYFTLDEDGNPKMVSYDDILKNKWLQYKGDSNDIRGKVVLDETMFNLGKLYGSQSINDASDWYDRGFGSGDWVWDKDAIKDNPKAFAVQMIQVLNNSNLTFLDPHGRQMLGSQILRMKQLTTPAAKKQFLGQLINFILAKGIVLNYKDKLMLNNLAKEYSATEIPTNKSGGILYAEKGRNIGAEANAHAKQVAGQQESLKYNKYGSVKEGDAANREFSWSNTDIIRLGSLLADVVSTGTSFAKGWGSIVSAGTGALSSVGDFAADWMEDGLLLKDVGKLFGNLFLDAAGSMITPLKFVKMSKKLKTMVPLLETSIAILGGGTVLFNNFDEYKQVVNKIKSGATLNVEDMRALASGLTAIASMSRVGTQAYHQRRIKNALAKLNPKDAGFAVSTNKGDKELTKDQIDQIMAVKPAAGETVLAAKNKKLQELVGDNSIELKPDQIEGKHIWSKKTNGTDWTAALHVDFDKPAFSAVSGEEAQEAADLLQKYQKRGNYWGGQYERYSRRWGTPGTVPATATTVLGQTLTPLNSTRKKDGGRLERLQNYIKSK